MTLDTLPAARLRFLLVTTALTGATIVTAAAWAQQPAPIELPTLEVSGTRERANGPVDGFAAQRSATGTKTDAAIEETPGAITVVPRDQLDLLDARSLNEALRYTAGVYTQTRGISGSRYDLLTVRGFGTIGGINNLYLNGSRLLGAGYSVPQIDAYALERIELLKGPASILYGQANPAGLINMVSKLPTETSLHEIGIEGGSYGTKQGTVDLSGKLTEDGRLLGRFTGLFRDSDGPVTNDYARERRILLQPSLTYRGDADTLTLQAIYERDPYGGYYGAVPQKGSALYNPLGKISRDFYDGEPGHEKYDRTQYGFGYQAEHRFNDSVALRQNFRYYRVESDYASVYSNGLLADNRTVTRGVADSTGFTDTYTVDNQAEWRVNTGPIGHTLLAGLDYLHSSQDYIYRINSAGGPTLDLFNPHYGSAVRIPAISTSTYQVIEQLGLYSQDQIKFGKLTLLLGGRSDWAGQDTQNRLAKTRASVNNSALSGRGGLIYNFDNGIAPYYSYSQSFQPSTGTNYAGQPFQPTRGESQEIGVKYAPPGLKSIFTLDYFDTTQSNVLTTDPNHTQFSIQSGEIRSRGVEAEAHASPLPGVNLVGSYTFLDARYTKDNSGYQGKALYAAPKHSASGFAEYTFQSGSLNGLGVGGGVRYFGTSPGNVTNTFKVSGATLVDAVMHYDLDKLFPAINNTRLQVNASNIADKTYVAACTGTTSCFYGAGRTVLASLKYRW